MNSNNTTKPIDEAPHFVDSEDCQGHPQRYWRQFLFCSDGKCVSGTGETAEIASRQANEERTQYENMLSSTPAERIKTILQQSRGRHFYSGEEWNLFQAFAEILGVK